MEEYIPLQLPYPLLLLLTILTIITSSLLLFLRRQSLRSSPPLPPSPPSLPIVGHLHLLSLPLHHSLLRLSHLYGPVLQLRLGNRRVLIISSAAAIHDCLVKNDLIFSDRPAMPRVKNLTYDHTSLGNGPYGPLFRSHRRTTNAVLLSSSIVQSLSLNVFQQEIKLMLKSLLRKEGDCFKEVRVHERLWQMMMNMMMRAIAGKRCFKEDDDEITEIGRKLQWVIEEYFSLMATGSVVDFLPFLKWVGVGLRDRGRMRGLENSMDGLMVELLEEGRKERRKKKEMLQAEDEGNKKKRDNRNVVEALLEMQEAEGEDVYNEVYLKGILEGLLLGGIHTVSHQLEWTLALLVNNPAVKKTAASEINTVVGSDRLLDYSDLPNLPYLNNVIKESLRLYPIGPLLFPHESSNECTIAGFHVPRGTMLFANVYALHRDPEYWVNPTSFKPERHFEKNEEIKELGTVYLPFGKGRRTCPGSELGMRVMTMALGGLLQCFEWERVGEELVDMSESSGIALCMLKPLVAKYRARQPMPSLLS